MMGCCKDFEATKIVIEDIVKSYYPNDYKIFVAQRIAGKGIAYKLIMGIVIKPDVSLNTMLFEALIKLDARTDVCVKVLSSAIEHKDNRLIDLFLLEIETEVNI